MAYVKPSVVYVEQAESAATVASSLAVSSLGCGPSSIAIPTGSLFQHALVQQYGFELDTAQIIVTVWNKVVDYTSDYAPDEDGHMLTASYTFFRLLGGFVYNDIKWQMTAGCISGLENNTPASDGVPTAEKNYFVNELNIEESVYRRLRYKVRIQNFLSQRDADVSFQTSYVDSYNTALQNNIDESSFIDTVWNPQVRRMQNRVDFAHFCIGVATRLATALGHGVIADVGISVVYGYAVGVYGIDTAREYFASWLGDLCLEPYSMGPDDFAADADVLSFSDELFSRSFDVESCFVSYFTPNLLAKRYRQPLFLRYLNTDEAADVVLHILFDMSGDARMLVETTEGVEGYTDVCGFFQTLLDSNLECPCEICVCDY